MCVHHINRSGPNVIVIHLEKTNRGCRSGPCSSEQEGKKGIKKRSLPGVQTAKTKGENNSPRKRNQKFQSRGENKTRQKQNRKASETIIDTNGCERETRGQVKTLYSLWSATRKGEAITLGIGVRSRQKAKHPSTRQLVGIHGTNGAAGGGKWPNQGYSNESHLSASPLLLPLSCFGGLQLLSPPPSSMWPYTCGPPPSPLPTTRRDLMPQFSIPPHSRSRTAERRLPRSPSTLFPCLTFHTGLGSRGSPP